MSCGNSLKKEYNLKMYLEIRIPKKEEKKYVSCLYLAKTVMNICSTLILCMKEKIFYFLLTAKRPVCSADNNLLVEHQCMWTVISSVLSK